MENAKCRKAHGFLCIMIGSHMGWISNDFHKRHSYKRKSLANHHTRDQISLFIAVFRRTSRLRNGDVTQTHIGTSFCPIVLRIFQWANTLVPYIFCPCQPGYYSHIIGSYSRRYRWLACKNISMFPRMPRKVWGEITYPFPNFNGAVVDVWGWISNFIPHFMIDVITYPCWD